ncbi:trichohyalin-like [Macrobrachium nipponense]|uniref:trichohyalin-like n=1 Tax=Macrobrachium nipponense TaxID=159736 RepID=UPI0030C8C605
MFYTTLKEMNSQAIIAVLIVLVAVFVGLISLARHESGVLHQLVGCEQHVFELEGRLATLQESFTYRIISWLLPEGPHFLDETVASSPAGAFRRILSLWPRLARFWQSRRDLQQCELVAQNLETKLRNAESKLGYLRFVKSRLTNQMSNIFVYFGVFLAVAAIALMSCWKSSTEKEQESENEQWQGNGLESDWSSMDGSLESTEEQLLDGHLNLTEKESHPEEHHESIEEERALFQRMKEQMEAEIGRLRNDMNVIQKNQEAEAENAIKTINGLREENQRYQSEIAHLAKITEATLKEKQAMSETSANTVVNLQRINEQLKAQVHIFSRNYKALKKQWQEEQERANVTIQDLQERNDQLLKEIADKEASAEEHRIKSDEMELSVHHLRQEVERAQEETRTQFQVKSQLLEEKEDLMRKFIKQQGHVISAMTKEKRRLKLELTAAKISEFVQGEQYQGLLAELSEFKNKGSILENTNSPSSAEDSGTLGQDLVKENVCLPDEEVNKKEAQKADESHQVNKEQKEDDEMIVTVKGRVKSRDIEEEDEADDKGCQNPQNESPPRTEKPQQQPITLNPMPNQPQMESDVFSRLGWPKPSAEIHQLNKGQKEDDKMIVTVKARIKCKEIKEEDEADKKEDHRVDQGCQNFQNEDPPSTEKPQQQPITSNPRPDQPKMKSNVFSRLGWPKPSAESHQVNKGKKDDEIMIVTIKDRVKGSKLEKDEGLDKKDDQKVEEGCKKSQKAKKARKARKAKKKLIKFDL